MPTYTYEVIETGEIFEVEQRMSENAMRKHPETGVAVRRVIASAPGIVLKHGSRQTKQALSDRGLAKTGLSRYEKTADGTYTRTAGSTGPESFSRGDIG